MLFWILPEFHIRVDVVYGWSLNRLPVSIWYLVNYNLWILSKTGAQILIYKTSLWPFLFFFCLSLFIELLKPVLTKVSFTHRCTSNSSHHKNLTSLFLLIFLSKHISLYALCRLKWIPDIIWLWPLNKHFNPCLKNQRN